MKYSIVYSSTGNTKLLADAIKNELNDDDLVYYGKPDRYALEADLIYVGFWTDQSVCDDVTKDFLRKIHNKNIFLFGSAGYGNKEYFEKINKATEEYLDETVTVVDYFMCQGKMGPQIKQKYLDILAKDPDNKRINFMLQLFDAALTHPNQDDFNDLIKKIK